MNKERLTNIYESDKITKTDWILLGIAGLLGALFFCYYFDMPIVIKQADDAVNILFSGKIFSFYSITMEHAKADYYGFGASMINSPNYNVLIYIVIGLWNLPLRLAKLFLGDWSMSMLAVAWTKMFIVGCGVLCGVLMNKISAKMYARGIIDVDLSKCASFLFLSSTVFAYGNVIFGQFDIIAVLLVLLAMNCLMDNRKIGFLLWMSLAVAIKDFALFAMIPIILLLEKRLIYLVRDLVVGFSVPILFKVIYHVDPGYAIVQDYMKESYNFVQRLYDTVIDGGVGEISSFIVIFGLICAFSFYVKNEKLKWKLVFVMPLFSYLALSIFVSWHPQWLVCMVPWIVWCLGMVKNKRNYMLTELVFYVGYLLSCIILVDFVDYRMVESGILGLATGRTLYGDGIYAILMQKTGITDLPTLFLSIMVIGALGLAYLIARGLWDSVRTEGDAVAGAAGVERTEGDAVATAAGGCENAGVAGEMRITRGMRLIRFLPIVVFMLTSLMMYLKYYK